MAPRWPRIFARGCMAAATCLWSRCAARTLLIVGDEIPAPSLQQLHASVQGLPWRTFLHPGQPLTVKATVKEAQFKRADAVEHHVLVAVEEALRKAPRQHGPRRREGAPPPQAAAPPRGRVHWGACCLRWGGRAGAAPPAVVQVAASLRPLPLRTHAPRHTRRAP